MTEHDKKWIVTTSGDRPAKDVATALKRKGFIVGSVLDEIGVITGRFAPSRVGELRGMPGVSDVAPDQEIDIGPPGRTDTW